MELEKRLEDWRHLERKQIQKEIKMIMGKAGLKAYKAGLIVKTDTWRARFGTEEKP